MRTAVVCLVWLALLVAPAPRADEPVFEPARLVSGAPPANAPPTAVGWVSESVEVTVDTGGQAQFVEPLQSAGANALNAAVMGWTFEPARDKGKPVAAHVLVAGIFRPPISINAPTAGTPPVSVGSPSSDVPSPITTATPDYPPNSLADGVVVVEVLVGVDGRVTAAKTVDSAAGLDDISIAAARQWTFTPALHEGQAVPAYVYLVFGFRRPVV